MSILKLCTVNNETELAHQRQLKNILMETSNAFLPEHARYSQFHIKMR